MMKKFVWILLITAILTSCSSKVQVHGKIEGIANKKFKICLIAPEKLTEVAAPYLGKVIDSAIVKSDGSFIFRNLPKVSNPMLLEVTLQPAGQDSKKLENENPVTSNYMPIIWQEGEQISISANAKTFQQSFSLENPSDTNKSLLKLRDIKLKAYKKYLQNKHWDVEQGSQLLDKEKALLNYQNQLMIFAKETNQFLSAMVALRWVSPSNDYERIPEFLFNQCNKWQSGDNDNPWVEELCAMSEESNLPILIGATFPEAQLPLLSGDVISLNETLGGKLTIIDLWASWCAPCRKENRDIMVPLWNEYNKKGLQIIGYGLESDKEAWKAAIIKDGVQSWPQASHLQGDDTPFLRALRIQTIPANFILDANGKVLKKNLHGEDLMNFVQDYLN